MKTSKETEQANNKANKEGEKANTEVNNILLLTNCSSAKALVLSSSGSNNSEGPTSDKSFLLLFFERDLGCRLSRSHSSIESKRRPPETGRRKKREPKGQMRVNRKETTQK